MNSVHFKIMPIFQSNDITQMTVQSDILLCLGFGYTAERLSTTLLTSNWSIMGTSRSSEKARKISALGENFSGIVLDSTMKIDVPTGAHLLISAPPDDEGCPAFRAIDVSNLTASSITYLSTTGVYGDHAGGWVYENTPVTPQSDRAKRRVIAERQWQTVEANIVRLPGIYGPGRSAFDRLRAGTAKRIIKPGQVFSRIHVDDIARGLHAILTLKPRGGIFHLCDDEPAPPQDVIAYAADLLGIDVPPDIPIEYAELSAMGRSFYAECKRVSNAATKERLDWHPQYPTYREGLEAILEAEAT